MATTLTTNSIKYEILREEDEDGDASEEGSEIIIITPIHSEREHDNDASVLSIVLSQDNNTRDTNPPQYSVNASQQFYQLTNNNDNLDSSISMPAFSAQPCVSSAIPPPPYEGAEGVSLASGTTTSLNLVEGSDETQNLMTLMMLSNYSINNPHHHHHHLKMSPNNGTDGNLHNNNNAPAPGGHNSLPSYDVATDLPSYEEAERTKEEEMRLAEQQQILDSQQDEERNVDSTTEHLASMAIGTDWTFLCTFIISFLFNWIGFLLSLCITSTVSGRCGALAGLGLSVVKWVAIVKQSKWASGFAEEESWLWWSLMVCGLLLFIRGCVQYIHIKYEWKKIAARIQQFYFF